MAAFKSMIEKVKAESVLNEEGEPVGAKVAMQLIVRNDEDPWHVANALSEMIGKRVGFNVILEQPSLGSQG